MAAEEKSLLKKISNWTSSFDFRSIAESFNKHLAIESSDVFGVPAITKDEVQSLFNTSECQNPPSEQEFSPQRTRQPVGQQQPLSLSPKSQDLDGMKRNQAFRPFIWPSQTSLVAPYVNLPTYTFYRLSTNRFQQERDVFAEEAGCIKKAQPDSYLDLPQESRLFDDKDIQQKSVVFKPFNHRSPPFKQVLALHLMPASQPKELPIESVAVNKSNPAMINSLYNQQRIEAANPANHINLRWQQMSQYQQQLARYAFQIGLIQLIDSNGLIIRPPKFQQLQPIEPSTALTIYKQKNKLNSCLNRHICIAHNNLYNIDVFYINNTLAHYNVNISLFLIQQMFQQIYQNMSVKQNPLVIKGDNSISYSMNSQHLKYFMIYMLFVQANNYKQAPTNNSYTQSNDTQNTFNNNEQGCVEEISENETLNNQNELFKSISDKTINPDKTPSISNNRYVFANFGNAIKSDNSGYMNKYTENKLFSNINNNDVLIEINYPEAKKLTSKQAETLKGNDGLEVISPSGMKYRLIENQDGSTSAVLRKSDAKTKFNETPLIHQQRIAATIINMIDNVIKSSDVVNVKTSDPFVAQIATNYINFLKEQGKIINKDVTCTANQENKTSTQATKLFKKLKSQLKKKFPKSQLKEYLDGKKDFNNEEAANLESPTPSVL